MSDASRRGRRNRAKGAEWDRTVRDHLRRAMPWLAGDIRRGLQSRGAKADAVADVEGVPGLWVECKRGKRVNVLAALAQAQADAPELGTWRAVFVHLDQQKPGEGAREYVAMPLEDWLDLWTELSELRER